MKITNDRMIKKELRAKKMLTMERKRKQKLDRRDRRKFKTEGGEIG